MATRAEQPHPAAGVFSAALGSIDRAVSRSNGNEVLKNFIGRVLASGAAAVMAEELRARQARRASPRMRNHVPPRQTHTPPAAPRPDPREVLGFEPSTPLTAELVRQRRKELAKIFHPDTGQAGSEAAMKRVNAAAEELLANLA